jgi:hypothetical protein
VAVFATTVGLAFYSVKVFTLFTSFCFWFFLREQKRARIHMVEISSTGRREVSASTITGESMGRFLAKHRGFGFALFPLLIGLGFWAMMLTPDVIRLEESKAKAIGERVLLEYRGVERGKWVQLETAEDRRQGPEWFGWQQRRRRQVFGKFLARRGLRKKPVHIDLRDEAAVTKAQETFGVHWRIDRVDSAPDPSWIEVIRVDPDCALGCFWQ